MWVDLITSIFLFVWLSVYIRSSPPVFEISIWNFAHCIFFTWSYWAVMLTERSELSSCVENFFILKLSSKILTWIIVQGNGEISEQIVQIGPLWHIAAIQTNWLKSSLCMENFFIWRDMFKKFGIDYCLRQWCLDGTAI